MIREMPTADPIIPSPPRMARLGNRCFRYVIQSFRALAADTAESATCRATGRHAMKLP
jgi:hypothetical protein